MSAALGLETRRVEARLVFENAVLFDCGCSDELGFRPSSYLPELSITSVEELIISNFDDDHVRDLDNLLRRVKINTLVKNPTLPAATLERIKLRDGPLTKGLKALVAMMDSYTETIRVPVDLAGIQNSLFWNAYPAFTDTNNLSLVTFVEYDGFSIVIPGDLTREGWLALLGRSDFRQCLSRATTLVASHHGREDGYCEEEFKYCHPELMVISDGPIQYDTQEHCYDDHASGISWPADGPNGIRYVLTTRSDGSILFSKKRGERCLVSTF